MSQKGIFISVSIKCVHQNTYMHTHTHEYTHIGINAYIIDVVFKQK